MKVQTIIGGLIYGYLNMYMHAYTSGHGIYLNLVMKRQRMFYEFGIFSTFYPGKEMPALIKCRRKGPSISFTIPSYTKKLGGLNFCSVERLPIFKFSYRSGFKLPLIKISNITKNHTWIYKHYNKGMIELGESEHCFEDGEFGKEYCFSLLSHWMFGPNEMKADDHITITVSTRYSLELTLECGIGLVYDDGSMEEDKDVLGYYKSWNHIVGGDLSHFQTSTGDTCNIIGLPSFY
ncbi:hypothetical protein R6Q59_000533 [Mikania micrantha]